MDIQRKLEILADAAKYDASCASSGTEKRDSRDGKGGRLDRAGHGHLPFLRPGRALHLAVEYPSHQRLQL
jgi:predicted DNA-binding helix-hairpin-helix protein